MKRYLIVLLFAVNACSPDETTRDDNATNPNLTTDSTYDINIDLDAEDRFTATLPDNTTFTDQTAYEQNIPIVISRALQEGHRINIIFGKNITHNLDAVLSKENSDIPAQQQDRVNINTQSFGLYVGWGYNLTSGSGYHYVSGCIKTNAYRVAIRLNRYSTQVFDIHLATYTKNGFRCFGAYESVHKYINWCTCSPVSYSQVKDIIRKAAIAAGISATIATVIATAATPIVFATLAL